MLIFFCVEEPGKEGGLLGGSYMAIVIVCDIISH